MKVRAHTYTAMTLKADFDKYDKDKDGKWNLEEFLDFITESCAWYQPMLIHSDTLFIPNSFPCVVYMMVLLYCVPGHKSRLGKY